MPQIVAEQEVREQLTRADRDTGKARHAGLSGVGDLVKQLFAKFNDADLPYLVLRNYHGYPDKLEKPDIGLLVDDRSVDRVKVVFQRLCEEQGYACVVDRKLANGLVMSAVRLVARDNGGVGCVLLKIDARAYKSFKLSRAHKAIPGFSYKVFFHEVRRRKRIVNGCEFFTYDQPDELIMLFRQWKRKQQTRYRDQIIEALADDKLNRWVCRAAHIDGPILPCFWSNQYEDRYDRLVWQLVTARWGKKTLGRVLRDHWRAVRVRLHRRGARLGPVVYFSGPDGSGKTTVVQQVREQLERVGIKYKYLYSLKKFLRFVTKRLIWLKYVSRRRGQRVRGFESYVQMAEHRDDVTDHWWWYTRKYMALVAGVCDICLGSCLAMLYRMRGRVVLIETSPYDVFVKYHMPEFVRSEKVLARLIQKPSMGILLRATPEQIHMRKPELSREQIEAFYSRLEVVMTRAKVIRRFIDVDTAVSPTCSAVKASNQVLGLLGARKNFEV